MPTLTFDYTGAIQTFLVPVGVSALTIDAYGAEGGTYDSQSGSDRFGGLGGRVKCDLSVTPGETLQINIGGAGRSNYWAYGVSTPAANGGWNGGGDGGGVGSTSNFVGGGGGGATDIRRAAATGVSDNFNRANASSLGGIWTSSDYFTSNSTWSTHTPVGINGNQARANTATANSMAAAIIDTGSADVDEQVTLAVGDTTTGVTEGLLFRYVDSDNFWYLNFNNLLGGRILLQKRVAGASSTLATINRVPTAGDIIRVVAKGNDIVAYVNGVASAGVQDSSLNTATKHGIFFAQGSTASNVARLDDFSMGGGYPLGNRLVVAPGGGGAGGFGTNNAGGFLGGGGTPNGQDGRDSPTYSIDGGRAATASAAGAGGTNQFGGQPGNAGFLGQGGTGFNSAFGAGGGGGGGRYGGGGGAGSDTGGVHGGGAGGGGSGLSTGVNETLQTGARQGHGLMTITYAVIAPSFVGWGMKIG